MFLIYMNKYLDYVFALEVRMINVCSQATDDWAQRVWSRMDRDRDGFLTRQELACEASAPKKLGPSQAFSPAKSLLFHPFFTCFGLFLCPFSPVFHVFMSFWKEFYNIVRAAVAPQSGISTGGAAYSRTQVNVDAALELCLRKADVNKARRALKAYCII